MTNSSNPKICPCTDPVKDKETFFWFIIITDLIFGMGLLALISLCVYCSSKTFNSCFFKCYAVTRLVLTVLTAILMAVLFIALLFIEHKQKTVYLIVIGLSSPLIVWLLYIAFQFNTSISDYQNEKSTSLIEEDKEKVPVTNPEVEESKDIEKNTEAEKVDKETDKKVNDEKIE